MSTTYESVVNWWRSKNLRTVNDFNSVLDNFKILFTCQSNTIDGEEVSYHTTREIFEDSPISAAGITPRAVFEVYNQKFTFDYLMKSLAERKPIDVSMVLKVHEIMMRGCYDSTRWDKGERPGQFKVGDYCVGMTDEGAAPEDVPKEIRDLLEEVTRVEDKALILSAAYFHANFESIHPFAVGNGRVGRVLLNYLLMLNNHPPVVIYAEDKETYYMGLEVFDRTGDLTGLMMFLHEQTVKTWASRLCNNTYTPDQIAIARKYAPDAYKSLSDNELWCLVGNYVKELEGN